MVELRNDGSICARDGQVCSDAPVEPAPAPADECNGADIDESGSVGVDDLLSLLSMFGRQC
jgi:hypothetical protein